MAASLECTTLDRVKLWASLDVNDTTDDEEFALLIAEVSTQFENYIGKHFLSTQRTEVRDVPQLPESFFMFEAPIASIASIKSRTAVSTAFSSVTAIQSTLYHFDAFTGRIVINAVLYSGPAALEVIYTAGFSATTAAFTTAYPDIAGSADRQIAHIWHRRKQPGRSSASVGGESLTVQDAVRMLPSVKETLNAYRRVSI